MESTLYRLQRIQEAHEQYSKVIEQQLSILFEDISKITPLEQGFKDKTDENANSNASRTRGALRRSGMANNNSRSVPNSVRVALANDRDINNKFKLIMRNNVNRGPRIRRTIRSMNGSGLANQSTRKSCTTSKKMHDFSVEPVSNKRVEKIPGIGPKAAEKLSILNYLYARRLLGKFLETDKKEFLEFLRTEAEVLPHNAEKTWKSLDDYRINHL